MRLPACDLTRSRFTSDSVCNRQSIVQEIDREQPDENHLPEPQVARCPMIGRHFRIAIEETFPDRGKCRRRSAGRPTRQRLKMIRSASDGITRVDGRRRTIMLGHDAKSFSASGIALASRRLPVAEVPAAKVHDAIADR